MLSGALISIDSELSKGVDTERVPLKNLYTGKNFNACELYKFKPSIQRTLHTHKGKGHQNSCHSYSHTREFQHQHPFPVSGMFTETLVIIRQNDGRRTSDTADPKA